MQYRVPTTAIVLALLASLPSSVRAAANREPGRSLYVRYCAACHGPEGKGDGLVGTFMRTKPADLTAIAARHGGEFPTEHVVQVIDGRDILRAHGEPAM